METVREVKKRFGVNMTLGASYISFGMPDRLLINSSYLAIMIAAGVNCPMVDVTKVRPSILATDLLLCKDQRARRNIEAFRIRQSQMAETKQ